MMQNREIVKTYHIPTHLNIPDRIEIPLPLITMRVTIRQGAIYLVGGAFLFQMWKSLAVLDAIDPMLRWFLLALMGLVLFLFANMTIQGRAMELWILTLIRYYSQARITIWRHSFEKETHA